MSSEPKAVKVDAHTPLLRLLKDADEGPVRLEKDGVLYLLASETGADSDDDIWADYDPDAALATLEATAGSWSDVDVEALIANIYRWREEGSRQPSDS